MVSCMDTMGGLYVLMTTGRVGEHILSCTAADRCETPSCYTEHGLLVSTQNLKR